MATIGKQFYTVEDFSTILDVSESTTRNWIDQGILQAYKVGRLIRIPIEAIDGILTPANPTFAMRASIKEGATK